MYSYYPTETKAVSARIRRDLFEYLEMQGLNKNRAINKALEAYVRTCQRDDEFRQHCLEYTEDYIISHSTINMG